VGGEEKVACVVLRMTVSKTKIRDGKEGNKKKGLR
jgi:hypothetical protein